MTIALLVITAVITLALVAEERFIPRAHAEEILLAFGVVPARFRFGSLLTYTFVHAGLGHLLINLFYLWVFGAGVEEAVGRFRFLLLYLVGGAVGGALQALVTLSLLSPSQAMAPIVGASAACSALVGLYAVRYYRARLEFVGLSFQPHVVTVVSLYLGFEIGAGMLSLVTGGASDGVAHWAHVGGFVFGLVCAHLMHLDDVGELAYMSEDASEAIRQSDPGVAIKKWEAMLVVSPKTRARMPNWRTPGWFLATAKPQETTMCRRSGYD